MSNCRIRCLLRTVAFAGATILASAALSPVPARAADFKVTLKGSFTLYDLGSISPPLPFVGSFDVDTNAAPVQTLTEDGVTVTGYANAAISAVSIAGPFSALQPDDMFSTADIIDRGLSDGQGDSAVYFSSPLSAGTNPLVSIEFAHRYVSGVPPYLYTTLFIGGVDSRGGFSSDVGDALGAGFQIDSLVGFDYGTVSAQVTAIDVAEPAPILVTLVGLLGLSALARAPVAGRAKEECRQSNRPRPR